VPAGHGWDAERNEIAMSVEQAQSLITIELPRDALSPIAETPEAFAKELRVAAAIEWYREGRVSHGEGAGIAGLSRVDFNSTLEAKVGPLRPGSETAGDAGELGLAERGDGERSLREDRQRPGSSAYSFEAGVSLTIEAAETHYQGLGRWRGRATSPDAQEESRRFWRESGLAGVRWLVGRLRDELHDDRLRGTAATLADLGSVSLGPILEALRDEPTTDQALALLWALGWLGDRQETEDMRAELILVQYLFDENAELREASARAMRLIPPHRAKRWLTRRLRDESGREVRLSIEDELEVPRGVEEKTCIS
jgi:hypothetical protein